MPYMNASVAGRQSMLRLDIFYRKVLSDPRIGSYFCDIDMDAQRAKQKSFLSMALGGRKTYTGKDLREAHERLVRIDQSHGSVIAGNSVGDRSSRPTRHSPRRNFCPEAGVCIDRSELAKDSRLLSAGSTYVGSAESGLRSATDIHLAGIAARWNLPLEKRDKWIPSSERPLANISVGSMLAYLRL